MFLHVWVGTFDETRSNLQGEKNHAISLQNDWCPFRFEFQQESNISRFTLHFASVVVAIVAKLNLVPSDFPPVSMYTERLKKMYAPISI